MSRIHLDRIRELDNSAKFREVCWVREETPGILVSYGQESNVGKSFRLKKKKRLVPPPQEVDSECGGHKHKSGEWVKQNQIPLHFLPPNKGPRE